MNRRQQGLFRNISLLYLVETRHYPTIIQIMRQERNCYRQLKVWNMRLTSCIPALDMLTLPLVSLSKPVGPFNELGTPWRAVSELNHAKGGNPNLSMIFFKEQLSLRVNTIPCLYREVVVSTDEVYDLSGSGYRLSLFSFISTALDMTVKGASQNLYT